MKNTIIAKNFLINLIVIVLVFNFLSCGKKIQLESYLKKNNLWPMYGKYPERKFFVEDTLKLPLKIIYKTELKAGLNFSSISSMDDLLFIGDLKGYLYLIDLNSGRIKNYNSFKQPILTSIIVKENELIFPLAANRDKSSYLIVYDLLRGEEKTRFAVEGSIEKEILILKGNIYLTSVDGIVYKLKEDLTIDWKLKLGSQIYSHLAAGKDFLVTASIDGYVFLISDEGKIIKRLKIENPIASGFTVNNSIIIFGDEGGYLYCYDVVQDKFLLSKKLDAPLKAIPSFDGQNIFVGDLKGNVFSVNMNSGKIIWTKQLGGLVNNSILIVGDKLVVPNFQKKIFILDKHSGKILQEIELDGRVKLSPVYIKNKLILGYDDKKIVALSN